MKFGLRTPSWAKTFGAYRSQWKRALMRLFFPGAYGKRSMGWLTNPRKAAYNWWYNRTSFGIDRVLGVKRVGGGFGFACFLLASIVCLPADMINSGVKASRIKKARKQRASSQGNTYRRKTQTSNKRSVSTHTATSATHTSKPRSTSTTHSAADSVSNNIKQNVSNAAPPTVTVTVASQNVSKPVESYSTQATGPTPANETPTLTLPYINDPATIPAEQVTVPEKSPESTPKSKPKYDNDQYIRKRMIIAGSSYCDSATLDKLYVGAYIEIVLEPDNAYDKDAIMPTFEGTKIGYIAKADKAPYVTCIKLGRSVYGVITDIKTDVFPVQYEYETWFNSK